MALSAQSTALRRRPATCISCSRSLPPGGGRCKRRDCRSYVDDWLRDQGVRVLENLAAWDGQVLMVTVTPPGADRLPWELDVWEREQRARSCVAAIMGHRSLSGPAPCDHDGPCASRLGCRVDPDLCRSFNAAALQRWSELWETARTKVWRAYGGGQLHLLAYTMEPQRRGVLHMHLVLGFRTARERGALGLAVSTLKRNAAAHGWGFVDDGRNMGRVLGAGPAAAYVSKYLTKPEKSAAVRTMVLGGQFPRRGIYVANRLSGRTRTTMRNLRAKRQVWAETREQVSCAAAELLLPQLRFARTWHDARRRPSTLYARVAGDGDDPPPAAWPFVAEAINGWHDGALSVACA